MKTRLILMLALMPLCACNNDDDQNRDNEQVIHSFDFSTSSEGWDGDFADYPAGEEEMYELEFGHSFLPTPLDNSLGALRLSGRNYSDDLFMYVSREITGLIPNREYLINFEVEFASDVPDGSFGIGGSPGESVYIKAGAAPQLPEKIVDELGWYRLNIDKGNQAEGGRDMITLGNFANGTDEHEYSLKTLTTSTPFRATTNNQGSLWILLGTDSGFEGKTTIYINRIVVMME